MGGTTAGAKACRALCRPPPSPASDLLDNLRFLSPAPTPPTVAPTTVSPDPLGRRCAHLIPEHKHPRYQRMPFVLDENPIGRPTHRHLNRVLFLVPQDGGINHGGVLIVTCFKPVTPRSPRRSNAAGNDRRTPSIHRRKTMRCGATSGRDGGRTRKRERIAPTHRPGRKPPPRPKTTHPNYQLMAGRCPAVKTPK